MARFGHRFGSIASVLTLVGGMLLVPVPRVAAATCAVTNEGTGTTYGTVQEAIAASADRDTLVVSGTCGRTRIREKILRLKGAPTPEQPTPTLEGGVVVYDSSVVLRDLRVVGRIFLTPTTAPDLFPHRGRLVLKGTTSVTGSEAYGIYNDGGTLILNGSASVTANTGEGGITNWRGTVILNDSASVTGNTATNGGGIRNDFGTVTLNDSASVTGNTAGMQGGGIYNDGGTLILNDSASVTGNTSEDEGGGIYNAQVDYGPISRAYVCSDQVAISPNDPDDPPKVRHACP